MATPKATSAATTAASATTEKRSTVKLDTIRQIERQMQQLWSDLKIFEVDAPGHTANKYGLFIFSFRMIIIFLFSLAQIHIWQHFRIHI
jgi:hypothetical protein